MLLVSATLFEIRPLLDQMAFIKQESEQLTAYRFREMAVDVLIPGVGMVPTAYFLGKQLALKRYDLAINAGIAGTFNPAFRPGSVVNVIEDCVPELGAEDGDNFLSVFELGLTDPDTHPYAGGKLVNQSLSSMPVGGNGTINGLPAVKGITSNTVRGNAGSIERIRRLSGADIESMEGAAFLYACLCANIPCAQVRAISNHVEIRDRAQWNLDLALKNLNDVLWEILTVP